MDVDPERAPFLEQRAAAGATPLVQPVVVMAVSFCSLVLGVARSGYVCVCACV